MEPRDRVMDSKRSMSADDVPNMMDFGDVMTPAGRAAGLAFGRPQLNSHRQTVYEDKERVTQVLTEMHRFYLDGQLCDIILEAEESRYPCHRLVLAASSLYFERMFSNGMCEASAAEIRLNNVTSEALQRLIDFAYTSKLTLTCDYALETFEAADMLQFERVRGFCAEFLCEQIDERNCLSFLLYADAFACSALYERAMLHAAKHFQIVSLQQEFLSLPLSHLSILLREDNLDVEYEEFVHEALKRWVLHDRAARASDLPVLFAHVRLNFVSRWYLIDVISKDEMLVESVECRRMVQSAKDQLLAQGHTYEIPWQLPPSRKCTGLTQKIVYVNTHDPYPSQSEVFLFDVVNKSWSSTGRPCPLASELSTCVSVRGEATAASGGGDSLLIIGGWTNATGNKSLNQRGAVSVIHEFKVMSIFPTLWYVGAHQMSFSRYLHSSLCLGTQLYLLGGYDETHALQSSVFIADTSLGGAAPSGPAYRFEPCAPMPLPLARPALASWGDCIYAFGGFGPGGQPSQKIFCYNVVTNRWKEVTPGVPLVGILCGECGREFGENLISDGNPCGGVRKSCSSNFSNAIKSSCIGCSSNNKKSDCDNVKDSDSSSGSSNENEANGISDSDSYNVDDCGKISKFTAAAMDENFTAICKDTKSAVIAMHTRPTAVSMDTQHTAVEMDDKALVPAMENRSEAGGSISNNASCNESSGNSCSCNKGISISNTSCNDCSSNSCNKGIGISNIGCKNASCSSSDEGSSERNRLHIDSGNSNRISDNRNSSSSTSVDYINRNSRNEENSSSSTGSSFQNSKGNSSTNETTSSICKTANISKSVGDSCCNISNSSSNEISSTCGYSTSCKATSNNNNSSNSDNIDSHSKTTSNNSSCSTNSKSTTDISIKAAINSSKIKSNADINKTSSSRVCPQCSCAWEGVDLPTGRVGGVNSAQYATFINGQFYVVCGTVGREGPVAVNQTAGDEMGGAYIGQRLAERVADSVFTFDPLTRRWTLVHHFSETRMGCFSIVTLRDRIYLAGGMKGGAPCRSIDCFDPQTCCVEAVGSTKECTGSLSLCTTLRVMHENFGL